MPQGKHRASHRAPSSRPLRTVMQAASQRSRVAFVVAPLATVSVVGAGVAVAAHAPGRGAPAATAAADRLEQPTATATGTASPTSASAALPDATAHALSSSALTGASRSLSISRGLDRLAVPEVSAHRWTTAPLDLRLSPGAHVATDGVFDAGKRIAITGEEHNGYAQVVVDGHARWVTATYLADHKPAPDPASRGPVFEPCAATASVEHGLVPAAVRAWEAVCNAFPEVTTYGGVANRPEHDTGHAVDAMVYGDSALGDRIAAFLQAHAAELDLYDLIWQQHIWTPVRASEGWRLMPDRGSPTANHMDHVHFAVN
ncbi:MAG: mucin-2 protein [Marmoricola sp.]